MKVQLCNVYEALIADRKTPEHKTPVPKSHLVTC